MPCIGQKVGEYVLEERVGKGAFGEVWRARHHVWSDRIAAVKIPTDTRYVANLRREGQAVYHLEHPNIVRPLGLDPYADPPYLVMEYVPGTSLRPLIQNRSLSVDDAVAIMRQVLEGLGFAHECGLVHRDIKPENILIHERAAREGYGAEGVVKLTDFGMGSAPVSNTQSIVLSMSMEDAGALSIAGTLDYMAPEQRHGGTIDARADLYACGVVLYEMLTGERPAGTDVPSDLNGQVPRYLDEVFRRSYARLETRFRSAREFLDALRGPATAVAQRPAARPAMVNCPNCHALVDAEDQFCMYCGLQLREVLRCLNCGAYPLPGDSYCMRCGQRLNPQAVA